VRGPASGESALGSLEGGAQLRPSRFLLARIPREERRLDLDEFVPAPVKVRSSRAAARFLLTCTVGGLGVDGPLEFVRAQSDRRAHRPRGDGGAKEAAAIDLAPWGKVRALPNGKMQMFVRDPSGNLVEVANAPVEVIDPALFEDELVERERGIYRLGPGVEFGEHVPRAALKA